MTIQSCLLKILVIIFITSTLGCTSQENECEKMITDYLLENFDDPAGFEVVKFGPLVQKVTPAGQFQFRYMYCKYRIKFEGHLKLNKAYFYFDDKYQLKGICNQHYSGISCGGVIISPTE